jgi:hypothetical protein
MSFQSVSRSFVNHVILLIWIRIDEIRLEQRIWIKKHRSFRYYLGGKEFLEPVIKINNVSAHMLQA